MEPGVTSEPTASGAAARPRRTRATRKTSAPAEILDSPAILPEATGATPTAGVHDVQSLPRQIFSSPASKTTSSGGASDAAQQPAQPAEPANVGTAAEAEGQQGAPRSGSRRGRRTRTSAGTGDAEAAGNDVMGEAPADSVAPDVAIAEPEQPVGMAVEPDASGNTPVAGPSASRRRGRRKPVAVDEGSVQASDVELDADSGPYESGAASGASPDVLELAATWPEV